MRTLFFLSVVFMFASGCALAPKVVHLEPLKPVANSKLSTETCFSVGEFKDERKDPQILGHTYNLGIKTSDVKTFGNVSQWIRTAYIDELKNSGGKECPSGTSLFVISGTVKEVAQEESWNINTSIKVDLQIAAGQSQVTNAYEGTSSQISHAASDGEFTDSLYKAVQDLMSKSIPAIVAKVEETK